MTATPDSPLGSASCLVNFWDILTAPDLALKRVSEVQPRSWWLPALLSLVTPLLYLGFTMDMQIEQARKAAALTLSKLPAEQVEAARPLIARMTQPQAIFLSATGGVALGLVLSWALSILILYFGIALLGSSVGAGGLWAAIVWTWVPLALRPLVQLAWSLHAGALVLYPGLSRFVAVGNPMEDQRNPLFVAASQIDLFALWHIILIYVLLRVVGRLGRGRSIALALLYALAQVGVRVLPTAIAQMTELG